ncbi:immunity-related GTPase family M protein 1 [Striga asiatica]|uniref:Immunity-related GTPase family M protein 1 n=1 Tax=Striga asiatica TaxID=4170 RepID=A0A5A7PFR4_STRAF|nr:immunity-related GTPase family M protein 1 [Striga asiatica]
MNQVIPLRNSYSVGSSRETRCGIAGGAVDLDEARRRGVEREMGKEGERGAVWGTYTGYGQPHKDTSIGDCQPSRGQFVVFFLRRSRASTSVLSYAKFFTCAFWWGLQGLQGSLCVGRCPRAGCMSGTESVLARWALHALRTVRARWALTCRSRSSDASEFLAGLCITARVVVGDLVVCSDATELCAIEQASPSMGHLEFKPSLPFSGIAHENGTRVDAQRGSTAHARLAEGLSEELQGRGLPRRGSAEARGGVAATNELDESLKRVVTSLGAADCGGGQRLAGKVPREGRDRRTLHTGCSSRSCCSPAEELAGGLVAAKLIGDEVMIGDDSDSRTGKEEGSRCGEVAVHSAVTCAEAESRREDLQAGSSVIASSHFGRHKSSSFATCCRRRWKLTATRWKNSRPAMRWCEMTSAWPDDCCHANTVGGLLLEVADGQLSWVMTMNGPPLSMRCHGVSSVKAAIGGSRGSKDSPATEEHAVDSLLAMSCSCGGSSPETKGRSNFSGWSFGRHKSSSFATCCRRRWKLTATRWKNSRPAMRWCEMTSAWPDDCCHANTVGGLLLEVADGQLSWVMTMNGPPLSMRCHGVSSVKAAIGGSRGSKDSPATEEHAVDSLLAMSCSCGGSSPETKGRSNFSGWR